MLLSVLFQVGALIAACCVWCFNKDFIEIVLESGIIQSEAHRNESKHLKEFLRAGCLDPLLGFEHMEKAVKTSVHLAGDIGMDPLSIGLANTKQKNKMHFDQIESERFEYFASWFHYLVATMVSASMGILFVTFTLLYPVQCCQKFNLTVSIVRNVITITGFSHYAYGYATLSSIDKLELNYLFGDSVIFYVGAVLSISSIIQDISGSVLTLKYFKSEGDAASKPDDATPEHYDSKHADMDRRAEYATKLKIMQRMKPRDTAAAMGPVGPGPQRSEATNPQRVANQPVKPAPSYRGNDPGHLPGWPTTKPYGVGRGKNVNQARNNQRSSASKSSSVREPKAIIQGNRDRGNRRVLTAEEAAMVDWKRFHRVVSDRDQAGRHHFLYQLPANNRSRNGVAAPRMLTEAEALKIDWKKFHRVGGPRDQVTGRRSCHYKLPFEDDKVKLPFEDDGAKRSVKLWQELDGKR